VRQGLLRWGSIRGHRSIAPALSVVLLGMLAVAFIASALQVNLVLSTQKSVEKVRAYRAAYVLVTREYLLLQATINQPRAEEGWEMTALQPQVLEALDRAARMDASDGDDFAGIRGMEVRIQAVEWQVVTQLADTHHRQAVALVVSVQPLMLEVSGDLAEEMRVHADVQSQEARTAAKRSVLLAAGIGAMVLVGIALIFVTAWINRADRRMIGRLASEDALTGLPNRTAFTAECEVALASAKRESALPPTVLLLDLDEFNEVNDSLGYPFADRVLQEFANRLRFCVREQDHVARLGGDEFAILVVAADPQVGEEIALRVTDAMAQPFLLDDIVLDMEVSIGLASGTPGQLVDSLIGNADLAMHLAKDHRLGFTRFDPERRDVGASRLAMLGSLRKALDNGEITLHYQPKVSLVTGEVTGAEALARWNHPTRGVVGPGDFIPALERTSMVFGFTVRVITDALRQARVWMIDGTPIPVSVNVPARCLLDEEFPQTIAQCLTEAEVPGYLLCVEITENIVVADPDLAIDVLHRIQALGVRTSVDDFGTGYSSLAYLRILPVDELKIDRSFIRDMTFNDRDHALVRSMVDLGHHLGLSVVAEGVETQATMQALRGLGCDVAQGYFFARPQDSASFQVWKAKRAEQAWEAGVAGGSA
jgi:diguanylate cyclase (GGDEF)-like protein